MLIAFEYACSTHKCTRSAMSIFKMVYPDNKPFVNAIKKKNERTH